MKRIVQAGLGALGFELRRKRPLEFAIGDLRFAADPCSVGETPQGERTADGAARLIRERSLTGLRVLDVCCGVGIIGLLLHHRLGAEIVPRVGFVDLNVFNLNSLRRTLSGNGLHDGFDVWLSDGLAGVPDGERFDLIVSNPPHFLVDDFAAAPLSPETLGTYDEDWRFHREFYAVCDRHLTERGEVWFLENGAGANEGDLLPFVEANPALRYRGSAQEPLVPGFFWMFTGRA